ncbi:MAG TPA: polyhydroxyalkanoic acid system family protein [Thermoanaerobaculia bacterium]
MRVAVPHNTTRESARRIVDQRLGQLLGQFGQHADDVQHEWTGDTLRFKGKARGLSVEGTVEVTEAAVIIDGKLPFLAMPFEGKIREAVEREAAAMFPVTRRA